MSTDQLKVYFVGSLISSVLAGILLLVTDFAGWYNYSGGVRSYGYIYSTVSPINLIIFGAAAIGLFYCSYLSVLELGFPDNKPSQSMLQIGFISAIAVFLLCLGGGIYFIIDMLIDEPSDWWLDTAFYAGVIGGGLTALFFYLALYRSKSV